MRAVAMLDNPTWATRLLPEMLRAGGHYYLVRARGDGVIIGAPFDAACADNSPRQRRSR
jgi:hypothetical protein